MPTNKLANLAFGHGGNVVTILHVKTKGEGSNLHHRVNGHTGSQTIHVLIWQSGFATDREDRFVFVCLFVLFCFILFLFYFCLQEQRYSFISVCAVLSSCVSKQWYGSQCLGL